MVWIVQEKGFERELLSSTSNSSIISVINDFSQLRGLPVVMPMMDLTDLSALSTTDVWGRFSDPLAQASMRYLAEAVVVFRVSDSSLLSPTDKNVNCQGQCQTQSFALDWSLMTDLKNKQTQVHSEHYQGDDVLLLLNQALADITDVIYQKYALLSSNSNELYIDVVNIDSLNKLIEVTDFLEELSAVESVQLVSAKGESRRFKLSLIGSPEALVESLQLSKLLNHITNPLDTSDNPLDTSEDSDQVEVFYWGKK